MDLTPEQFAELTPSQAALFPKTDKGVHTMATEFPDAAAAEALRTAKQHEVDEHKTTKNQLKALEKRNKDLQEASGASKEDLAAIEDKYNTKLEQLKADATARTTAAETNLKNIALKAAAKTMAVEVAGESAELLEPHILSRLAAELVDGKAPLLKVLDKDGGATISTLDDLKAEFIANPAFKAIVVGSKADGSGAPTKPLVSGVSDLGKDVDLSTDTVALMARTKERRAAAAQ